MAGVSRFIGAEQSVTSSRLIKRSYHTNPTGLVYIGLRGMVGGLGNVLRMTVRTLAIKLTDLAFTLVVSYVAPNPGSACVRPHPTICFRHSLASYRSGCSWGGEGHTAR